MTKERKCEICREPFRKVAQPFEYTALAGLDPKSHTVLLHGIEVYRCGCGVSPVIPNIDGLHTVLSCMYLADEAPLDSSVIRFIRKTLGLTQVDFGKLLNVTSVTISNWERGDAPGSIYETALRAVVVSRMLEDENFTPHLQLEQVRKILKAVQARIEFHKSAKDTVRMQHDPSAPSYWRKCDDDCAEAAAIQ